MQKFLFRISVGAKFEVRDSFGHPLREVDALLHLTEMAKLARSKPKPMNSNKDLWEVTAKTSAGAIAFAMATMDLREKFSPRR